MSFLKQPKSVPASRIHRLTRLGGTVASMTANTLKEGVKQWSNGQTATLQSTVLTSSNAAILAKELSRLRGAAMKVGQLISMDSGELLPPEWQSVFEQLRQSANPMPKKQLLSVLRSAWGDSWQGSFSYFSFEPIAAASIGQVHKATLKTGEELAVKVQYPGVKQSIDADLDNVARLMKLSGMVPNRVALDSVVEQAKAQLKEEADYLQEADYLRYYAQKLEHQPAFRVPKVFASWTNEQVLTMSFERGESLSSYLHHCATDSEKQRCLQQLFELTYCELFDFQFMQTDPNYANFLVDNGVIVLLDCGACRHISKAAVQKFSELSSLFLMAEQPIFDRQALQSCLVSLGLLDTAMSEKKRDTIIDCCVIAAKVLSKDSFNIGQERLIAAIQQRALDIIDERDVVAIPDFEVALINRKIMGLTLLASDLEVSLELRSLARKAAAISNTAAP